MADIRVTKNSKLTVTVTPGDDCIITVRRGFAAAIPVQNGGELPTRDIGVYLVVAADNENRPLVMTLTGQAGHSTPPVATNPVASARVRLTYEVAP